MTKRVCPGLENNDTAYTSHDNQAHGVFRPDAGPASRGRVSADLRSLLGTICAGSGAFYTSTRVLVLRARQCTQADPSRPSFAEVLVTDGTTAAPFLVLESEALPVGARASPGSEWIFTEVVSSASGLMGDLPFLPLVLSASAPPQGGPTVYERYMAMLENGSPGHQTPPLLDTLTPVSLAARRSSTDARAGQNGSSSTAQRVALFKRLASTTPPSRGQLLSEDRSTTLLAPSTPAVEETSPPEQFSVSRLTNEELLAMMRRGNGRDDDMGAFDLDPLMDGEPPAPGQGAVPTARLAGDVTKRPREISHSSASGSKRYRTVE